MEILEKLCADLPSVVMAFLFDLMTGQILARKGGRGSSSLRVGILAERVPSVTQFMRDLVAAEDHDEVETIEVSAGRVAVVVALVSETQEAIAVVAERAQPTALIGAALLRAVRGYATRAGPTRLVVEPPPSEPTA